MIRFVRKLTLFRAYGCLVICLFSMTTGNGQPTLQPIADRLQQVEKNDAGREKDLVRTVVDTLQQAVAEHTALEVSLLAEHYANPAMKETQFASSLSSFLLSFDRQTAGNTALSHRGVSEQVFLVLASSHRQIDSLSWVWGHASYNNSAVRGVRARETSHYLLTAPYTTYDTLGGNMAGEAYAFSGGYARLLNERWGMGLQASYEAYQESRNRDPRILNRSGDLNARLGAQYRTQSSRWGTWIFGRIYKQVHGMTFLNPVGATTVFNRLGFDQFSGRFVGNPEAKAFNGYGYGIGIDRLPVAGSKHPYFSLLYSYLGTEYTLKERNELRLAYLHTHTLDWQTSYRFKPSRWSWILTHTSHLQFRRGDEEIYGSSTSVFYPHLSTQKGNYRGVFFVKTLSALSTYDNGSTRVDLLPAVAVDYSHHSRPQTQSHERFLRLIPSFTASVAQHMGHSFRLRSEVGATYRHTLSHKLLFGSTTVDELYRTVAQKLRTMVQHEHLVQTVPHTLLSLALSGEQVLSSWHAVLYARLAGVLRYTRWGMAPHEWNLSLGILF